MQCCLDHICGGCYPCLDDPKALSPMTVQVSPSDASASRLRADAVADGTVQAGDGALAESSVTLGLPKRFVIVILCFVAFMLCNMDRVNMSIAILPMQQEFGWTAQTVGIVQSSFFWCSPTPLLRLQVQY
jgi:hypothetical protein